MIQIIKFKEEFVRRKTKKTKRIIENRFFLILARTIDHRIGKTDKDHPSIPILTVEEALVSFFIRFVILFVNFVTCAFVIANIIHRW